MPQHGLSVAGNLLAQPEVGAGMDIDQYALEGAAALLERASAHVLAIQPKEVEGVIDRLVGCLVAGVAVCLAYAEGGLECREARNPTLILNHGLAVEDGRCDR